MTDGQLLPQLVHFLNFGWDYLARKLRFIEKFPENFQKFQETFEKTSNELPAFRASKPCLNFLNIPEIQTPKNLATPLDLVFPKWYSKQAQTTCTQLKYYQVAVVTQSCTWCKKLSGKKLLV